MPTNPDMPTHCLYYRALGAEQWRMFAYFDDLTEDECEELRKYVAYESAPHSEEICDEFTAVWEPSKYEFKCIEQTGHVALRSKLESDKRELDRLVSGQLVRRGEEYEFTLILWNFARRNKNQVHPAIGRVGKDGDSESDREGPPEAEYTATDSGLPRVAVEPEETDVAARKPVKPSHTRAKSLYDWAMKNIEGAEDMTYAELFDALQNDPACDGEGLPGNSQAFSRYCRGAGIRRNSPKRTKEPTRSVRRADQI